MRPPSILMFERLFLASLALSVLSFIVGYEAMTAQLASEPGMAELGLGSGFMVGSMVVGLAIYLLLWFLIARKASNVAKWILIVFLVISLISVAAALTGSLDLMSMLSLAVYALEVAAVVYLFRDDAKAWLKGEWNADAATFD